MLVDMRKVLTKDYNTKDRTTSEIQSEEETVPPYKASEVSFFAVRTFGVEMKPLNIILLLVVIFFVFCFHFFLTINKVILGNDGTTTVSAHCWETVKAQNSSQWDGTSAVDGPLQCRSSPEVQPDRRDQQG